MAMEIFTVGRGQEGYPGRLMPFADMPSRLFVRGALPADEQKTSGDCGRADMYGVRKEPGGLFRAGAGGKRCGGDQRTGVRNRRGGARGGTARKGKDVCRAWLRRGYLLSETELSADAADAGKRRRCLKRISAGRRAASVAFPDPQPRDQCAGRCRSGN